MHFLTPIPVYLRHEKVAFVSLLVSMFALFSQALSGREKFIQSVRLNAGLELSMKPSEQMSPMATLDFTPSLPNGDRALPLRLQAVALFLKEDIGEHRQRTTSARSRWRSSADCPGYFPHPFAKEHG